MKSIFITEDESSDKYEQDLT
jgi:hypothetical protein